MISLHYELVITNICPRSGSLYGGTKVTISGQGFSSIIEDNVVHFGTCNGKGQFTTDAVCDVLTANTNTLVCLIKDRTQTHIVTNQGILSNSGKQ